MSKVRLKQIEDITAADTFLEKDLLLTTPVGEIKQFDAGKNYATISATKPDGTRKTIQEALEEIFSKDQQPTVTLPSVTAAFEFTAGSVKHTLQSGGKPLYLPFGTELIEPTGKLISFNPGNYSFGPDPGVLPANNMTYLLIKDNDPGTPLLHATVSQPEYQFKDILALHGSLKVSMATNYTAATAAPLTQLGNPSSVESIGSGTAQTETPNVIGYWPVYLGPTPKTADNFAYADISPLKTAPAPLNSGDTLKINIADFPEELANPHKGIALCLPKINPYGKGFEAYLESSSDTPITDLFKLRKETLIATPSGLTQDYDLWYFSPDLFQNDEIIRIRIK